MLFRSESVWSSWSSVTFWLYPPATPTPTPTSTPSCSGVGFGSFYFDNSTIIRQLVTNTTYPGLQMTGFTVDWGPLDSASTLYGWSTRIDWMNWDGVRVRDTNDYSSTTSANKNLPRPSDLGTHTIRIDFDGVPLSRLYQSPLGLGSSNFGFSVTFNDPSCNISRSANPDRKSTRLNSSHSQQSRMPSSA